MFLSEGLSSPPRNERGFVRHRGLQPVSLLVIIFRIMAWWSVLTKSWRCSYNMWLLVFLPPGLPTCCGSRMPTTPWSALPQICLMVSSLHCSPVSRLKWWYPLSVPIFLMPAGSSRRLAVLKQTAAQTSGIIISLHRSIKMKLPPALNVQPRLYVFLLKPGSTSPPYYFNIKHLRYINALFPFWSRLLNQTD